MHCLDEDCCGHWQAALPQLHPVNSHNEWDPLEEVIVGHVEGAVLPDPRVARTDPGWIRPLLALCSGLPYPGSMVRKARRELQGLVDTLEAEGVIVRRPAVLDGRRWLQTPDWRSRGFCSASPRHGFLVLGDEIMEAPTAWRCRHFEGLAYRDLFLEYQRRGSRWTVSPRPRLQDSFYHPRHRVPRQDGPSTYTISEKEPVFDGADFARCGGDLLATRSNLTNLAGIEWLRHHLAPHYRIHLLESRCRQPVHMNNIFVPLGPGRALINPEWLDTERLPEFLRGWELLPAPPPVPCSNLFSLCSPWSSLNLLMLDQRRVLVERNQITLIRALKDWGLEPLPLPFAHLAAFGGSLHSTTLDIRRRSGPCLTF